MVARTKTNKKVTTEPKPSFSTRTDFKAKDDLVLCSSKLSGPTQEEDSRYELCGVAKMGGQNVRVHIWTAKLRLVGETKLTRVMKKLAKSIDAGKLTKRTCLALRGSLLRGEQSAIAT